MPSIRFKLQELLEISAVPVPANPRALVKALWEPRKFYSAPAPVKGTPTPVASPLGLILEEARAVKAALMGPGGK
jgi:hypothetical protein